MEAYPATPTVVPSPSPAASVAPARSAPAGSTGSEEPSGPGILAAPPTSTPTLLPRTMGSPSAPTAGRTYVVQPGDTLQQIAAHTDGNPSAWPRLTRANVQLLLDPSWLQPGEQLIVPRGCLPLASSP